jgi:hypothetical protein
MDANEPNYAKISIRKEKICENGASYMKMNENDI